MAGVHLFINFIRDRLNSTVGMRFSRSFTLKDLSLKRILENLEFFIDNTDRIPQRHIDFLHRLFSEECYKQYINGIDEEALFNEECLLWFLSSHNKNVHLPYIAPDIVERLKIVGSGITSLTLQDATFSDDTSLSSALGCVPHLSNLNLSNTKCTDNTLLSIQKMCPDLVTLNVYKCYRVTDDGMVNLCGGSMALKNLNIRKTAVKFTGLRDILVGMPSLQSVNYHEMASSFHEIFESGIDQKFNLTELIYENGFFCAYPTSVIRMWTHLCPNVEKVHILSPLPADALMLCSEFKNLKEFEYKPTKFDEYYVCSPEKYTPLLCKLKNLRTLRLSTLKLPSVELFDCLSSLKDLYLNDITFTDFNEDEIVSKTTNLNCLTIKNLDLDMTCATYKFMALFISLSKNVTELAISNNIFPCDLIDIILNSMKNLIVFKLSLGDTRLPTSLLKFFDAPTIQEISIDGYMDQNLRTSLQPILSCKDTCTLGWRTTHHFMTEDDSNDDSSSEDDDEEEMFGYDTDDLETDWCETEESEGDADETEGDTEDEDAMDIMSNVS